LPDLAGNLGDARKPRETARNGEDRQRRALLAEAREARRARRVAREPQAIAEEGARCDDGRQPTRQAP
jgi:hypothetical protein